MGKKVDVKEATKILCRYDLVGDVEGTRRFIRRKELPAEKDSNYEGYRIWKKDLDAFIWVKGQGTGDVVQELANPDQSAFRFYNRLPGTPYKVASFFTGIGGFDLGFENVGMEVVFQCEINKFCHKVLKKHWPKCPLSTDIKTVSPEKIPTSNVWCGGFPCQDLSLANQGKRKGLKGDRSGLFYTIANLIEAKETQKPDWVILENVPGLFNSHSGQDFKVLLSTMDELGYGVSWRILDAKFFGTPQRRRRVYIVASHGDLRSAEVLFDAGPAQVSTESRSNKGKKFASGYGEGFLQTDLYSIQHASIGRKPSAGPQAKGYRNDGETYTLDSRGSSDAICSPNAPYRVREVAGLSSRMDARRFRAVGNAVAVPIIEWLAGRIITVDDKYRKNQKAL